MPEALKADGAKDEAKAEIALSIAREWRYIGQVHAADQQEARAEVRVLA